MVDVSIKLYDFLCNDVVGSWKVVKYRRYFYQILDYVANITSRDTRLIHVSSGSKAEGIDQAGSDFDVMYVCLDFPVYESCDTLLKTEINRNDAIIFETKHSQPGYVLLRVICRTLLPNECLFKTEFGEFLSSKFFKITILEKHLDNIDMKINGPCITNPEETIDHAYCLRCNTWPSIAEHWVIRPRSSGWPSDELISHIVEQGILFVPIGSKSDSQEANPVEWRMSFSIPEKMLIHSWKHSQFLCYALLKFLLKEIIQKEQGIEKILCSYFMKTTLFWISEEIDVERWIPTNLIECFMLCLKRLVYYVSYGYIPNYFIPQNNMIDRKIPEQSRKKLLLLLQTLYSKGWRCILLCNSLHRFSPLINFSNSQTGYSDFDKAMLPIEHMQFKERCCTMQHEFRLKCEYIKLIKRFKHSKNVQGLFFILFAEFNNEMSQFDLFNNPDHNNKRQYMQQQRCLSQIFIGTYMDAVSGWLLLALFFYFNKQYHKVLFILEYVESVATDDKLFLWNISLSDINRRHGYNSGKSFIYKARKETMRMFLLHEAPENDLTCDVGDESLYGIIFCPPVVFLHYLHFLCCHRLHHITRRNNALRNLTWTIENSSFLISDPTYRTVSYCYLQNAAVVLDDNALAFNTTLKMYNFLKSLELDKISKKSLHDMLRIIESDYLEK